MIKIAVLDDYQNIFEQTYLQKYIKINLNLRSLMKLSKMKLKHL